MRNPNRPWKRYLTIALVVLMTPIFVLGATVAATGTMTVRVEEKSPGGVDLYIPLPALLFDLAIFAVPRFLPDEELAEVRQEIAPFRRGLDIFAEELESMPTGVLVEVEDGDEHVTIRKSWRSFHIDVQSSDTDVSVTIPARLLSRSLDIL